MAQIINYIDGNIIFEDENPDIRETVEAAIEKGLSLEYADLSHQDLRGINFQNVNLFNANLSFSNFNSIDNGAIASEWGVSQDYELTDLSNANLEHANLEGSLLKACKLYKTNLRETHLKNADFSEADLRLADFHGANLLSTSFIVADLNGADFRNANLIDSNFSQAFLRNAKLIQANLYGTNFTNTILDDSDFNNANLSHTIFGLTDLSGCKNLEKAVVLSPCIIDFETLKQSPHIPKIFLRKIGLPDLYLEYLPDLYDDKALIYYPVFLSHTSVDKVFARKLYEALTEKGILTWFDEKKMLAGDHIYETISRNIKTYDKMILVCSESSLSESWWVDREIKEARRKEQEYFKKHGKSINIIVPITIDNFVFDGWEGDNKNYITDMHIADFRNWNHSEEFNHSLDQLVEALNSKRRDDPYSILNL